ncbi:unnamed protein product [Effrenium voratum]|nr:unnamed protein product [Effrenium voratum]
MVSDEEAASKVHHYAKMACNSSSLGLTLLGYVYLDGLSVEKDAHRAVEILREAVEKGNPAAKSSLSISFAKFHKMAAGARTALARTRRALWLLGLWHCWVPSAADFGNVTASVLPRKNQDVLLSCGLDCEDLLELKLAAGCESSGSAAALQSQEERLALAERHPIWAVRVARIAVQPVCESHQQCDLRGYRFHSVHLTNPGG